MKKDFNLIDYSVLLEFIDGDQDIKKIIKYLINNDYREMSNEEEINESIYQYIINKNANLTEFLKQFYYKDLYKSLYEYCLKDISEGDSFSKLIDVASNTYFYQKKLNQLLDISSDDFDRFLIGCVVGEMKNKISSYTFKYYEKEFFDILIDTIRKTTLNNIAQTINTKTLEKKLF